VVTLPEAALATARESCPVALTRVGTVREADAGLTLDGEPLPDRGYTHGAE
jgi:thiamine-monophosphate kinase